MTGREWLDSKTRLQQPILAITKNRSCSPYYRILSEVGPPHARIFTVGAFFSGKQVGTGKGNSRQAAEQEAAAEALSSMLLEAESRTTE